MDATNFSFRFSSLAAERISSRSGPTRRHISSSSTTVTKPTSGRRHHRRNDRGMEVDQVGSTANSNAGGLTRRTPGNKSSRRHQTRNGGSNRNGPASGGPRNRNNQKPKKSSVSPPNQSDLDKELESYMMKNDSTARNTLDMELDSYMSSAPSKSN